MFTLKALALVPALIVAASTKTEVGTFSEPTQGETLSLGQSYTARWSVKSDISLGPDATGKLCLSS